MSPRRPKNLQEETMPETTKPETATETTADEVQIQLFGATHGAEHNAIRTVTREKADRLIANGLAAEVPRNVEGVLVESDTAGTGPAVNAETGQVTQPGEPLPPIAQEGGTPLEPIEGSGRNGEPLDADRNGIMDILETPDEDA